MGCSSYSTIIVNDDNEISSRFIDVACAIGESVAVVDNRESFFSLYSSAVRCIVLDLSMPNFCGIEVIRDLANMNCCATLVLTTDISPDLLHLAQRLAEARGIVVAAALMMPFGLEQMQQALIAATDPAVQARERARTAASCHAAELPAEQRAARTKGAR